MEDKLKLVPEVLLVLSDKSPYPEKGKIEAISGLIDRQTGSVRFRATFPNPGGLLRSGTSAIVRIPEIIDSAIVIPQKSTHELQDKHFVYLVTDSGTVKNTTIEVVNNASGSFYVVTDGLKIGDKIIVESAALLKDGTKIKEEPQSLSEVLSMPSQTQKP